MRKMLVAFSAVVLAACGGGSSGPSFVNPDSVKFSYGTPLDPTVAETDAATAGESGAGNASALSSAPNDPQAQSLITLPDEMASAVFSDSTVMAAVQARAGTATTQRAAAYAAGDLVAATAGFDNPACVTESLNQIKYDHCVYTDTASGTVVSTNGAFTRQANAASTEVLWDVTVSISMSGATQGFTMHGGDHLKGDIKVTLAGADLVNIVGFARSEVSASMSGSGQSLSMALTHNADLDLDYQPSGSCVVGGTLELKRIWSERPTGASGPQYAHQGVKFEWTGCHAVKVSWGTLP